MPAGDVGLNGDFYIDVNNNSFYYGPKINGSWGLPQVNVAGTPISTGLMSGGVISFHAGIPNAFDVSAGFGYIADYITNPTAPTATKVAINAQTITLSGAALTRTTNWWLSDVNGNITSQGTTPTAAQRRQSIVLGVTGSVVGSGILFNVQPSPVILNQPLGQLYDLLDSLGPFSISGNIISANGANLTFNKSAGAVFDTGFAYATTPLNPHQVNSPAETPATFRYSTQISGSQGALTTLVDVANYDVGGVVTPIGGGSNQSSNHRVWLFGTGIATAQMALQYGQNTYSTLTGAVAAIGSTNYVVNPDYTEIGILIGWISVIRTATDLSDPTQATFTPAAKFASP